MQGHAGGPISQVPINARSRLLSLDRARPADKTRGERQAKHAPHAASPGDALLGRPRCQELMRLVAVAAELSMQSSNRQAIQKPSLFFSILFSTRHLIGSKKSTGDN